jgi:hypothetical protein
MNKEKQIIEDMAKHCHFCEKGKCLLLGDEAVDCDTECDICEFAKSLYTAGYRKQSEGEWYVNYMMSKKPSKRGRIIQYTTYTCSVCGKPNGRKKSKFCPNCGAKMKGGAE